MKKLCAIFTAVLAVLVFSFPAFAIEVDEQVPSALLIDANTGKILYEKDSQLFLNISGVNKLMGVALILEAIEQGKLNLSDTAVVSESVRRVGGATAFLEVGKEYTIEELLKAVITVNANDAMIVLAEKLYGNVETFVEKMNEKAKELGMEGSFKNVTGAADDEQLCTAKDVATLACYVLKKDGYTKYSKVYMYELKHPSGRVTQMVNTNRLIKTYDMCDGLMSGSQGNKNYSVAATGKKGDMRLVAVVLCAPNSDIRNSTAKSLLEYGFSNFVSKKLFSKDEKIVNDIKVRSGSGSFGGKVQDDLKIVIEKDAAKQIEKEYYINEDFELPIKEGDVIGEAYAMQNGEIIAKVNIVADNSIQKLTVGGCCKNVAQKWIGA